MPIRISIRPHWNAAQEGGARVDATGMLALLGAVHDTGSLAQAAHGRRLRRWPRSPATRRARPGGYSASTKPSDRRLAVSAANPNAAGVDALGFAALTPAYKPQTLTDA